ncbi:MAG: pseudouridine synthase [Candidatus Izemoplasmataceae bacterium]
MRLDKLLSTLDYGSRKTIKKLAKDGFITVNDTIIKDASFQVNPNLDVIKINQTRVFYQDQVVIMMHKPSGYVCANQDPLHKTVFELLKEPFNRYPLSIAGRLDKDTEGLLIFSDDGSLIHQIIHPKKSVYKTYLVKTLNDVENIDVLVEPMTLLDGKGNPYQVMKPMVKKLKACTYEVKIKEGKFHQIKRMFEHINHQVVYLKRTAIHDLVLDEALEIGAYKVLNQEEINKLIPKKNL